LFVYLFVCLCVCLFVCVFVCLAVHTLRLQHPSTDRQNVDKMTENVDYS
jgi:hypothetical protein